MANSCSMANSKEKIKLTQNSKDIPEDVITVILSRLPVKSLHRYKSVCKSWLSKSIPHYSSWMSSSCSMANSKEKIKVTQNNKDIPEDVITVILSRLPVKSLLRYKSVCKSWLSIISNPGFIKSHLHNAIIAFLKNPKIATLVNPVQFLDLQDLSFTCPVHIDFIVMPRLFHETLLEPVFVGCYNGIICLCDKNHASTGYLWNPSIRKCMKIPSPKKYQFKLISINFGYDSIDDDYKVIRINTESNSDELPMIQVYSTNANSWREFPCPILHNQKVNISCHTVVNGVLYITYGVGLILFNLHTEEVMGLVPFPSDIQRRLSRVLNFQDSVAILFESINDKLPYLWTLHDVAGQMTWIKRNSVKGVNWLSFYLGMGLFCGVKPVNSNNYIVLYDCEKKETKFCEPVNFGIRIDYKYTESLVSLERFQQVE